MVTGKEEDTRLNKQQLHHVRYVLAEVLNDTDTRTDRKCEKGGERSLSKNSALF